ncbi:hypothetical protein [Flavobacterium sp. MDT1-60]|uniref:hypothetical protein n=1 Tax=Flavobacterium sp. MDT1-60 TaxID=1979344 RepID=UPI0017852BE4|nr:hypothetical protein [Flavobacterium sp. MDT1-60]QOG01193.1 hypothetical protein IHE43_15390 [Flavobacterium sp. MDT1-60]
MNTIDAFFYTIINQALLSGKLRAKSAAKGREFLRICSYPKTKQVPQQPSAPIAVKSFVAGFRAKIAAYSGNQFLKNNYQDSP